MGLLSTHIFKKFCVFSISRFYSRSFVETLHFPSFLQEGCGKKRTPSVIAARWQIPPFVAARHLFLSLSPAVTFLPGAGKSRNAKPDFRKNNPQTLAFTHRIR